MVKAGTLVVPVASPAAGFCETRAVPPVTVSVPLDKLVLVSSVPACTVVPPVYVFTVEIVRKPGPRLVSEPAPPMPAVLVKV